MCSSNLTRTSARRAAPIALVNGHAKHLPATVKLLSAASVEAVRVGWLWDGWLARGEGSSPGRLSRHGQDHDCSVVVRGDHRWRQVAGWCCTLKRATA